MEQDKEDDVTVTITVTGGANVADFLQSAAASIDLQKINDELSAALAREIALIKSRVS